MLVLSRPLDKVVAKIERNQKDDGSFAENKGWAAVPEPDQQALMFCGLGVLAWLARRRQRA